MPTLSTLLPDTRISAGKILPGLILIALFTSMLFREWIIVGVIADPIAIAQYPFGSEEAMADGAGYYKTAELYAQNSLLTGLSTLPAVTGFIFALRKRTSSAVVFAYGLLLLTFILVSILSHSSTQ